MPVRQEKGANRVACGKSDLTSPPNSRGFFRIYREHLSRQELAGKSPAIVIDPEFNAIRLGGLDKMGRAGRSCHFDSSPITFRPRFLEMYIVLKNLVRVFSLLAMAFVSCGAFVVADETGSTVRLNADGAFTGNAFSVDGEAKIPQAATVSLAQDGKLLHSVVADDAGQFSFADVAPGVYSLVATAGTYVGNMTVTLEPAAEPATEPAIPLALAAAAPVAAAPLAVKMSDYMGDNTAGIMGNAPMASYSPGCATSGGGAGRAGIGGSRRLRRFLIIGGIVGGVVGGTAGRASPAE